MDTPAKIRVAESKNVSDLGFQKRYKLHCLLCLINRQGCPTFTVHGETFLATMEQAQDLRISTARVA
jgi:hypothetical protein